MKKIAKTRLFVGGKLGANMDIVLVEDHAHLITNVLRLKPGEFISLFNHFSGEWLVRLVSITRTQVLGYIETPIKKPRQERGPWLAFALIKKHRVSFIVEKATELGAEKLIPVLTEFSDWRSHKKMKLDSIARGATEQCGRLCVPAIEETCSFQEFISWWPKMRPLLFGDETGKGISIKNSIEKKKIRSSSDVGLLVGPEGGFSSHELLCLRSLKYGCAIDLGPRILRSETAAISAISILQALT